MAAVGMVAYPLTPTRLAVIGPAEKDGACPVERQLISDFPSE